MKTSILKYFVAALIMMSTVILFSFSKNTQQLTTHITGVTQLSAGGGIASQNGQVIGKIYVPSRTETACEYKEYWYLGGKYEYPSPTNQKMLTIKMVEKVGVYKDLSHFIKKMEKEFPNGYLIEVTANEHRKDCK